MDQHTPIPFAMPLLLWWMLTTLIAWFIGGLIGFPIAETVSHAAVAEPRGKVDDIAAGLLGSIASLTIILTIGSAAQWLSLRSHLDLAWRWIPISLGASFIGVLLSPIAAFVLAFPIGVLLNGTIGHSLSAQELTNITTILVWSGAFALIGTLLGLAQSFLLQDCMQPRSLWMWATIYGLTLGFLAAITVGKVARWSMLDMTPARWGIVCGIGGGVYSLVTGLVLVWRFQRTLDAPLRAKAEAQGSSTAPGE